MPDAPPLLAGRYRLGELLGRGGMGAVHLARDETLERDVAVKEIDQPPGEEGDAAARRTLREARAAARLNHPNVVQVYDVLQLDGRTWIVMEYVPSRSLRQVIAEDGPLDPYRAARIGLDLLAALRAAHRGGVQHQDVKPANVLLADDGRVLLTDFGIAAMDGDAVISRTDVVVGSPEFMAPERARSGADGTEADLWSLGATLYAAVEGRSPYQRGSTMATLTALATEEPDPPAHAGPLRPVLDGLLRKDPAQRANLEDTENLLRAALAELGDGSGPLPVRGKTRLIPQQRTTMLPGEVPDDAAPARRFGGTRLAVVAAVLLVAMAGTIWLVARPDGRNSAATGTPATSAPAGTNPPVGGVPAGEQPAASPSASAPPSAAPSSASPSPSVSPSPSPSQASPSPAGLPALPDGWREHRDPTGFVVYVPEGWQQSKKGTIVYFRGDGRVLGIDQTDRPKSNPVSDWRNQSRARLSDGDVPGYDEIKIAEVDYFKKAADWEVTFNGSSSRQHVNNRGVVISSKKAYGFYWQTRDSEWADARDDLQLVFDSFRPAR